MLAAAPSPSEWGTATALCPKRFKGPVVLGGFGLVVRRAASCSLSESKRSSLLQIVAPCSLNPGMKEEPG